MFHLEEEDEKKINEQQEVTTGQKRKTFSVFKKHQIPSLFSFGEVTTGQKRKTFSVFKKHQIPSLFLFGEVTTGQERKTFSAFKKHQIPSLFLFGSAILFGAALIIFSGFAWSLPLLLGFGFLVPSILAFANSILLMKPGSAEVDSGKNGIQLFVAKILRNFAWIIGGAALITSGAIFCSGLVAASLITFGALGVATGILKALIGSQSDFINTHREVADPNNAVDPIYKRGVNALNDVNWKCWFYKGVNILAFIGTGTLGVLLTLAPISLPFLPFVGIGIATLSVFGVVKSVLHLFLDAKASHVKCYKAAKYFKCGIFILGGAALIALTFLPITTALAGIIGTPAILLKIICSVIGAFLSIKGGISIKKNYSIVECILASRECDYIYYHSYGWRTELSAYPTPNIDSDINCETADACFGKV